MVKIERNTIGYKYYEWKTYSKAIITYKTTLNKATGLYTVRTCYWTETVKAEDLQRFINTIVNKTIHDGIVYTHIIQSRVEITETE